MHILYRSTVIVAIAIGGGLLLYALTSSLFAWNDTAAALWSWFLILASGVAAHLFLPRDLSEVTLVLSAILASVGAVIAVSWLLIVLLDAPLEGGPLGTLLLLGAAEGAVAIVVFLPIYVFRQRSSGPQHALYLISGALIFALPVLWILPPGNEMISWLSRFVTAAFLALIGIAGASAFTFVVSGGSPQKSSSI